MFHNILAHVVSFFTKSLISRKGAPVFKKKTPAASLRLSEAKLSGAGPWYAAGPQYAVWPGNTVGPQNKVGPRNKVGPGNKVGPKNQVRAPNSSIFKLTLTN